MSTPPEAQQAAEWTPANISEICDFMGVSSVSEIMNKICATHNAATAKLREELEEVAGERDAYKRAHGDKMKELARLLAHQQPSANVGSHRDQLFSHDAADAPVSQPSAPTPDVEKIVFDLQAANLLKDESVVGLRKANAILAQARAPLEVIRKHWPTVQAVIRSDIMVGEGIESVHAINAALTGTGVTHQ